MKNIIVIVDPFSSSSHLPQQIRKSYPNYEVVALFSFDEIPDIFLSSWHSKNFDGVVFKKDISQFIDEKGDEIAAVIPGAETGVTLVDLLSENLGIPKNPAQFSELRTQKSSMQIKLENSSLRGIKSYVVQDIKEIKKAFENLQTEKIVFKPVDSAGSDSVLFLKSLYALEQAFISLKGTKNALGRINEKFILQEYIDGTEYVVDLVANNGHFSTLSICKYNKATLNGSESVYVSLECLQPHEHQYLIDYAKQVAKEFNIKTGAIHLEIMVDEKGPVLIELGGRLHGGIAPLLFEKVYERSLLDSQLRSYIGLDHEESFTNILTKPGKICFLVSHQEGILKKTEILNDYEEIAKSLVIPPFLPRVGSYLSKTVDLNTCPGLFALVGDIEQIEKDEKLIHDSIQFVVEE